MKEADHPILGGAFETNATHDPASRLWGNYTISPRPGVFLAADGAVAHFFLSFFLGFYRSFFRSGW
jgi:hypothetical protein